MESTIAAFRNKFGNRIKEHEMLSGHTTFKIGGPADLFIEAHTKEELADTVIFARKYSVPFFILGGGTNILVSDKGIRGLVIKYTANNVSIIGMKGKLRGEKNESQVYVEADAGALFNKLVRYTLDEGLSGLEMHLGLPGTVGGAVYENSKWTRPKGYVGDVLYQGTILTSQNTIRVEPNDYFQFAYGKSILQKSKDILLCAVFVLKKDTKEHVWAVANESIEYRRNTQPQGVATAGCVFKNISPSDALTCGTPDHTTSAGKLLDLSGMKNVRRGGCIYSDIHANFIVNVGGGTASDVLQLLQLGKDTVKEKFGVTLHTEIQIIGEQ